MNYKEYDLIIQECKELSQRKNKDYGDSSLLKFGGKGVLIRMNDKIDRLNNIIWNNKKSEQKSIPLDVPC
jgi:hypothetical protein